MSLRRNEFEVLETATVEEALFKIEEQNVDLVILDWMLPGKSGIEFVRQIRRSDVHRQIPIIMLTAKAEEENRIKGFSLGVDDYVTKPFSPKELNYRVRNILRRGVIINENNEIISGHLKLNMDKSEAEYSGEVIKLTPYSYKLLCFFMTHPNKTYTRVQLIDFVWGKNLYIDDRTIDVQIRRLRDSLKRFGCEQKIKTIRGFGYQWVDNGSAC